MDRPYINPDPPSSGFWDHSHHTLPQGSKTDEIRTVKFLTNKGRKPRPCAGVVTHPEQRMETDGKFKK